uniref:Protein FAR1-RELATED SEQUENCE 4-like n=1 Tax=Nicotiana tabacum TaxID=4097 RepID=A0A1S4A8I5_TOBAC|nr:PREDICTED: uncharacterized protein LOC107794866 [Nicotiana tabacum]
MASLTILLRHSGKWNDEGNYIDFSIEGILIKEYASFNDLVVSISNQLGEAIGVFELHKDLIISKTNQKEVMAGQVYKDKATLKEVMENYAIAQRFQFRVDRSNVVGYALLCISKDCEWRFKASSINKSELFKVREFNDNHTCPLKDKVYEQRQASSSLIGGMIRPKLTNHKRKYTPRDIIDDVKSDLGVNVSYMLAWRAKEKAINFLRGEPVDSYKKLPGYLYTMDMTYPGSHIRIVKSPKNEFMYVYISLYVFIRGFDHCRPIVVVDSSHLKSYYTGTFVSTSTLDGAGHILPLAYGVIGSENDVAWTWFFEQFKIAYGERENMCIVSDRNESIIKSISRVYPDVPHFACINVYKKFKKSHAKLSEIYFSMAKAYTQAEFDNLMEKVEKVDIMVKEYLELAGYEKWTRLYDLLTGDGQ